MRKIFFVFLLASGLTIYTIGPAFAGHSSSWGDRTIWDRYQESSKGCTFCHTNQTEHTAGPHGGYQTTTDKCMACHTVHKAENEALLPGTTVTGTCNFCHDLTQTEYAPYYTAYLTSGESIQAAHQVQGLDLPIAGLGNWDGSLSIPGGDSVSGGAKNLDASAQGRLSTTTKFTCDSCHTPHAIEGSTVQPYFGESHLKYEILNYPGGNAGRFWLTDRLLKAKLNGSSGFKYTKYDSDWCAACHQGRYKNGVIHNHPVAMSGRLNDGVKAADPNDAEGYQYLNFLTAADFVNGRDKTWLINNAKKSNGQYNTFFWAEDGSDALEGSIVDLGARGSGERVFRKDPRNNKQFSMTEGDPVNKNTPRPDGYVSIVEYPDGPSCQQCHGNARDVEKPFLESLQDGNHGHTVMTFPHVSKNKSLTVENHDDFCTNCHGLDNLP